MLLVAVGAAAFAVACAALAPVLAGEGPFSWRDAALLAVGVPFFGVVAVFAAHRVLRPTPVVVLDRHGLHDHASLVAAGPVPWSEVRRVRCYAHRGQRFLGVEVRDPGLVLQRLGPLRRRTAQANLALVGCAVNVPQVALPIGVDALWREIRAFHPDACLDEPEDRRAVRRPR